MYKSRRLNNSALGFCPLMHRCRYVRSNKQPNAPRLVFVPGSGAGAQAGDCRE